tara:strand:+ start:1031 stop:1219 length:189 start_codon:yes stop_codon:yes gene_type:complete
MALPELIFASPEGGTINRYQLSGGKRLFIRFISCHLGSCRFYKNIEEAARYLEIAHIDSTKK